MQTGCKDPYAGRHNISGKITLNGVPLDTGTILFTPKDIVTDADVTSAQAAIKNGEYSVTAGLGLLAGEYKVIIQSQKYVDVKTGEVLPGKTEDPGSYVLKDFIPEKYGTNSEITFTVENKKGPKTFDFDIKTE